MRLHRKLSTLAALGASTLLAGAASGDLIEFNADLSGDNEVPPVDTDAFGTFTGIFDTDTNTFTFSWVIEELSGTPGAPGAHIHMGQPDENGPILFAMSMGEWDLVDDDIWNDMSQDEVDALFAGNLYANFHTDQFQGGEVRGQIVPAPAGFGVLGLAGIAGVRRRRRD